MCRCCGRCGRYGRIGLELLRIVHLVGMRLFAVLVEAACLSELVLQLCQQHLSRCGEGGVLVAQASHARHFALHHAHRAGVGAVEPLRELHELVERRAVHNLYAIGEWL